MQIKRDWKSHLWRSVAQGFFGVIALAFVTMACVSLGVDLATTAFAYLIVIVLLSLMGSFYVSAVLSIIAVAALNFFFAPPIFNFRVDRPQDAVVVIAFLLTSLIVTGLVRKARSQTEETLKAEDELQRMQAELAHVTRVMTLGELTSSIAHEVNQPLAAIVTNAESCLRWLDRETPEIDEARSASERIVRDAQRATEVIGRIRDLARYSDPEKSPLDINETIRETVPLLQRELLRQRVSLRLELASTLPKVLGDRVQLQQVIINLMVNGVEAIANATELPRELMIGSRPHDPDHVLVAVQDSGIGFDPENVDRLFTSFFPTKPGGMGMARSICRSIIEHHEARLWASCNDGLGSTFQLTLVACRESVSCPFGKPRVVVSAYGT